MGSRQQLAAERSAAGQTIAWIRLAGRAGGAAAAITAAGLLFWTLVPLTVGWRPEVVLSGSMAPHVAPGDVVLVASTNHAVRPGQVILFVDPARPDRRLLHRVVSRNPDGTYVTRGDANPSADSTPVPPGNVQGMARLRVPWIGQGEPALVHGRDVDLRVHQCERLRQAGNELESGRRQDVERSCPAHGRDILAGRPGRSRRGQDGARA